MPDATSDTRPQPRRAQGLTRRHVSEAQRARVISAVIDLARERGVEGATVSHIISAASVSRRTFYELFHDRGDCLLAAIEWALAIAAERAGAAYRSQEGWVDRVRAGLHELLAFFDEEPQLAWLCIGQSAAAGPGALALRGEMLARLVALLDEGGRGAGGEQPPQLASEAIVGGVLSVIHTRLLKPEAPTLSSLLAPLMSMIVLPYLGHEAAGRELSRPRAAAPRARGAPTAPNPLKGLKLRLTHRTLAVLKAIADEPGLSNREIGERIGVSDQGQISRMLGRLAERRLTENTGGGQPMGAANAWRLTSTGSDLESAIRRGWLRAA
jgi:AcrR family transcriptional regulator